MENEINNFINLIVHPQFTGILLVVQLVFMLISVFFVIAIILILRYSNWLKFRYFTDVSEIATYRAYGAKRISKDWAKILARLETGNEDEYKLAVIETDSMLDNILQRLGYPGATLGEKLKPLNSSIIPNIDSILQAHKVRNDIVHDPDYYLTLEEVKETLAIYEQTFKDLQVI